MRVLAQALVVCGHLVLAQVVMGGESEPGRAGAEEGTFDQQAIDKEVTEFFGRGAEGMGNAVEKVFKEKGRPNAYIKGEEASGALVVGLRYGEGTLTFKNGMTRKLYWQSPTLGFDFGIDASKVFMLVYNLDAADALYQRFPGVEGSLYFIGGVSVNYARSGDIILAPMTFGVGLRFGANVGYLHFTQEQTANPF